MLWCNGAVWNHLSSWVFLSEPPTGLVPSHLIRQRGRLEYPPPAALVSSPRLWGPDACDWLRFCMLKLQQQLQQQRQWHYTPAGLVRFDIIQAKKVRVTLIWPSPVAGVSDRIVFWKVWCMADLIWPLPLSFPLPASLSQLITLLWKKFILDCISRGANKREGEEARSSPRKVR